MGGALYILLWLNDNGELDIQNSSGQTGLSLQPIQYEKLDQNNIILFSMDWICKEVPIQDTINSYKELYCTKSYFIFGHYTYF